MNFISLKNWYSAQRLLPLRSSISAILTACNEATNDISEVKIKAAICNDNAHRIIFSVENSKPISMPIMRILVGKKVFNSGMSDAFWEELDFLYQSYHVSILLVALSFKNTYKIVFTTDYYDTHVSNHTEAMRTLESELAIAYPNATISIDDTENILSITNTIDF